MPCASSATCSGSWPAIAYYTYFEGGPTGQTIGKKALNITVVDVGGGPIGYGRGFLRYLDADLLSGILLTSATCGCCGIPRSRCWHDKIAGTYVVPADAYR